MQERLVRAAQAGEPQALDGLIASCLPLVYNLVGRALRGHADVDDVVQESLLRAVNGLGSLRDPQQFRSWLVTITMRQIRTHLAAAPREYPDQDVLADLADPGADFVDLTIVRLGLSGQRRETAEATRWLKDSDRELLALWWLELAGQLTRAEVSAALDLTPQHAAVRIQRTKAQLDGARVVVRALEATPRCLALAALASGWDGRPDPLWRKRFARHTRECPSCEQRWAGLVPVDGLLAGLALVPLPHGGLHLPAVQHLNGRHAAQHATQHVGRTGPRRVRPHHLAGHLAAKPIAVGAAALVATAVAVGAAYGLQPPQHHSVAAPSLPPATRASAAPAPSPTPRPTPSATRSIRPTGMPAATSSSHRASAGATPTPGYGSVVDAPDTAPPVGQAPGTLPVRAEDKPITLVAAASKEEAPFRGSLGGTWLMFYRGDKITVTGRGYFRVRWEIAFFNRPGLLRMPTWTGLQGKVFHVASGGGRRMDDTVPGATDLPHTWMGTPSQGYITLPTGTQQMWNNEFYYLDGTVTLNENEIGADYNLSVTPVTRAQIQADIAQVPGRPGIVRYGLVRDTGTDTAPVPQYATRATPAVPWDVAQHSTLG
jgi:RNA polymerase sigma factor (sigma-70 family)